MAAVGLKLGFTGAAGANRRGAAGRGLAHKMRPHTGQAREQIFILRQLNLKLTLAGLRALGKDVEYQSGAVKNLDAKLLGQHAHLGWGQLIVKHREVAVVHCDKLLHLAHLAVADEAARIGRRAALHYYGHRVAARGIDKRRKLLHGYLGGALALVHARRRQSRQHRAFSFYLSVFHLNFSFEYA